MTAERRDQFVTLQSVPGAWLPPTQTWLHTQLRFLPAGVRAPVACARVETQHAFPYEDLHPAAARLAVGRWRQRLRLARTDGHLARVARATGAHLVHSHFGPEGWRNVPAVRRLGIPHVVTFYGYDVNCLPRTHPRWRRRYRELFGAADLVLAEGEHMADCIASLGCPRSRLRVHRLGVDLETIRFRPRRWNGRGPVRVLLAAAFREKKGLPIALAALARLHADVPLAVTLIGDATAAASSQAEKTRVLEAIERGGLRDHVRALGFVSHKTLMAEATRHHLVVAPSLTARDGDTEGGAPIALIELAASGLPVVATQHCDIPAVVQDGFTGRLAREGDEDDLLRALRAIIDDAPRWSSMGRAARAWIAARFDARTQGQRLAGLYRDVAGARAAETRIAA